MFLLLTSQVLKCMTKAVNAVFKLNNRSDTLLLRQTVQHQLTSNQTHTDLTGSIHTSDHNLCEGKYAAGSVHLA